ncbi:hypothetical protein LWI29_002060 [Acer saccharum]|uniref:Uncharacterized protein n=1 Tax=Acer saccharum TaxID=4024 RepID=A0AA39SQB9_ACESA|nr:hypothetical protein LWI29_002060 [Acer saccharum]
MNNSSSSIQQHDDDNDDEEELRRPQRNQQQNTNTTREQEETTTTPRCEWDFNLSTVVSSQATGDATDVLGVIEFDPSYTLVATGGIARKIRLYSVNSLLGGCGGGRVALLDHASACEYYICTPAKLSSLKWRPGSGGRVLGSGDYDGVVTEYDLEQKVPVFERDEHGGRRVWSVDYSMWDPAVGASGSDDGTMQMWDPRCDGGGTCVATVQPSAARSSVCCVEFNPFGGALVAVGCADRKAYGYDVRKMSDPVIVFDGHKKTVTYIRFLDANTLVSAGTDGCLKLWNTNDSRTIRTYKGHVNSRSFVGLSVWRHGGLLGCGSENNQVFVYDRRWGEPIWVHGFESQLSRSAQLTETGTGFVSSVCWRQVGDDHCTLVAGGSDGVLQVYVGKKKPLAY